MNDDDELHAVRTDEHGRILIRHVIRGGMTVCGLFVPSSALPAHPSFGACVVCKELDAQLHPRRRLR